MKIYSHWNQYPINEWRWPNFKPSEMQSKSDHKLAIDENAMDKLQELRTLIGKPFHITSAFRSEAHNKKVGGAKFSQHKLAKAFDIQMHNHDPAQFEAAARQVGFVGFGFYKRHGFMHIDTRDGPDKEWFGTGESGRWFAKADKFHGGPIPDMAQLPDRDTPLPRNPFAPILTALAKLFGGKS